MNSQSVWNTFQTNFSTIIRNYPVYQDLLEDIADTPHNILLHCVHGFPIDLFIDEIIKRRFNIQTPSIYKNTAFWNKNIPYIENQYFFEINMMNPDIPKDISFMTEMILEIIKSKNVNQTKHFVIIKHIDLLKDYFFEFRIILERYSKNVTFMCFTHTISQLETPIRSRFNIFRIPLFKSEDIQHIFENHLNYTLPKDISVHSRDIIKAIFLSDVERQEPSILTREYCKYRFPLLYEFVITYDHKKDNLQNIRNLSYKCCQYNVSIQDLVIDFLAIIDDTSYIEKIGLTRIPKKHYPLIKQCCKFNIIKYGAEIDHLLCQTNKGREPIYIEAFLCEMFLNQSKKVHILCL
jgi:hypothetical protein